MVRRAVFDQGVTMDNIQQILAIAGVLIAVIISIAAALVFIRGAYGNARIQALREDNSDLRERVTDTEAERDVFKLRSDTLTRENTLLRDLTLQKANVDGLRVALMAHNAEEMEKLEEYTDHVIKALEKHDAATKVAWEQVMKRLEERGHHA